MTVSIVKTMNAARVWLSYFSASFTDNPSIPGMPPSISIELTNNCNLKCPECASGSGMMKRERGFMDTELYKKIMSELKPYLYYINLYFQGEPMLHPHFFSFPDYSDTIFTVVSTNGHFLTVENSEKLVKSGLKKLIVSLDGMDQDTYSAYRKNGDFSRVTEGIMNVSEAIRKMNSPLKLEIQYLVNKFNERHVAQAKSFAGQVRATFRLKSMQVLDGHDSGNWMPAAGKFRRYREENGEFRVKNSMPDRCMRLWFNPVITWDGKVVPCCFDKDAEYVMGDITRDSFRSIWNGKDFKDFRRQVLTGRKEIGICRNCTSGINLEIKC